MVAQSMAVLAGSSQQLAVEKLVAVVARAALVSVETEWEPAAAGN